MQHELSLSVFVGEAKSDLVLISISLYPLHGRNQLHSWIFTLNECCLYTRH